MPALSRSSPVEPPVRVPASVFLESLVLALVLSALAFWCNADQGMSWADEGLLWYGSQRVLAGELPVRDFYSYDPGRYFWTAMFFKLAADQSLRTTLLAVSAFSCLALTATLTSLAYAGLGRFHRVLLAIAITIAFSYPRHKGFDQSLSLLLACAILPVLKLPGSWRRWMLLGIMTGLAATMGRNHGVFFSVASALTGGYLVLSRASVRPFQGGTAFAIGTGIGYLPVIILCVLHQDFLVEFWHSVLQTGQWQLSLPIPFPWRISLDGLTPLRAVHSRVYSVMCMVVPAGYLLTLAWTAHSTRRESCHGLTQVMAALSLAGLPYLHQAFDRADFDHFVQGVLPAFALFTCAAALPLSAPRRTLLLHGGSWASLILLALLWVPYIPGIRMLLLEQNSPGSTTPFTMDGTTYRIESYQARLLTEARNLARKCQITDRQFLAAPHFPGLYAFLGVRAPAWESYYLHNRPLPIQQEHVRAMTSIRLAIIAPESTIDNLDRLRFRNMHGGSLHRLDSTLVPMTLPDFPFPLTIYTSPLLCTLTPPNR